MINKLRKNGGKKKKRIAINRKWKACTFEFVSVDFQLFRPIPVSFDPFHGLSAVRPVIRMDMEMDDNKRYHYEIKKRKRFDLFPLPLSFLSPSLSPQLVILKSESGFLFQLKKKKFFKILKSTESTSCAESTLLSAHTREGHSWGEEDLGRQGAICARESILIG